MCDLKFIETISVSGTIMLLSLLRNWQFCMYHAMQYLIVWIKYFYSCQYPDNSRVLPGDNTAAGGEAERESGSTSGWQNQPVAGAGYVP